MKTRRWTFGLLAAICVTGMALPPRAMAQVSLTDFDALKEAVQKLRQLAGSRTGFGAGPIAGPAAGKSRPVTAGAELTEGVIAGGRL